MQQHEQQAHKVGIPLDGWMGYCRGCLQATSKTVCLPEREVYLCPRCQRRAICCASAGWNGPDAPPLPAVWVQAASAYAGSKSCTSREQRVLALCAVLRQADEALNMRFGPQQSMRCSSSDDEAAMEEGTADSMDA